MTLALSNFATYCLQVVLVVGIGALLPYVFRLRAPRPRLVYWHLLLVACLALPLVQPWKSSAVVVASEVTVSMGPVKMADSAADSRFHFSNEEILTGILAAGAGLRLAWLCLGFWRLRRYRLAAEPMLPLPDDTRRIGMRLGVTTDFYLSEDVTSPVTFGARNPVVLLPAGFLELEREAREAVVCHELLHIQRNDWLFAIGEELVRSLLWFHPAVWWLLGRIQLTREEVVDQGVIEHTQSPDQYVEALIAIAAKRLQADLAPAPLFLKKRHLRQRVASIVKGVSMSKRNLWMSTLAVFSALPLVVGIAVWQFPLSAAPQEVRDGAGVDVKGGYYKVLHRTGVAYPPEANGLSGAVVVSVSVDEKGEVTDAKVVSSQGPDLFRKAVLSSVLNWHFGTEPWEIAPGNQKPVPPSFEVAVTFDGSKNAPRQTVESKALPSAFPAVTVERIDVSSLPKALQERLAAANIVREGDVITVDRMSQLTSAFRALDSHLTSVGRIKNDKVTLRVSLVGESPAVFKGESYSFVRPKESDSAQAVNAAPGQTPERIRVGGNVQAVNLIQKATPVYPPLAKQARIQGTVRLNVVIDRTGHVINMELVEGHPLLVPSATEAVQQWVYKPTLLNGNPVEVITQVDVNYTLLQ